MVLNAKNALKFIPSGLCEHGKLAQVGIDLSIKDIRKIVGGKLYHDGKKEIDKYQDVDHIFGGLIALFTWVFGMLRHTKN